MCISPYFEHNIKGMFPQAVDIALKMCNNLRELYRGEVMRTFNYSKISENKWDSELLGLIAAIYKEAGKQEMYLKQRPEELEKLVEVAKIQSTEASNAIEGIVTTSTRIRQLMGEKTTPRNRDEQEIAGYRDALNIIHTKEIILIRQVDLLLLMWYYPFSIESIMFFSSWIVT